MLEGKERKGIKDGGEKLIVYDGPIQDKNTARVYDLTGAGVANVILNRGRIDRIYIICCHAMCADF